MEKKQNVPALRFPGFSGEWKSHQLQSFGKATGGTPIESEFVSQGKYKVISIGSYSEQGTYIDQGIRANYSEKTAKRILNKDDLAMLLNDKTLRGNIIGRVLLIDADDSYVYNQRTERLEVDKDNFNPSFLHCLFNVDKIRKAIIYNAVGITQIHVNWSAISQLFYHIPPTMAEQNCISNFNIEYSQFILLQKNKIRKLQQFRQAMLAKLFPREGAAEPELRFRGFSGKWKSQKMKDLGSFLKGKLYSKKNIQTSGVPLILYGRLYTQYELVIDEVDTFAVPYENSVWSIGGEVIVPASGETAEDIAIASVVKRKGILLGGDLNIIRPNDTVSSVFLALSISYGHIHNELAKRAQGKSIVHIHNSDLVQLDIRLPSIEEQKAIGDFFYQLDRYISLQQKKLERMQRLKAALLEKLFV